MVNDIHTLKSFLISNYLQLSVILYNYWSKIKSKGLRDHCRHSLSQFTLCEEVAWRQLGIEGWIRDFTGDHEFLMKGNEEKRHCGGFDNYVNNLEELFFFFNFGICRNSQNALLSNTQ